MIAMETESVGKKCSIHRIRAYQIDKYNNIFKNLIILMLHKPNDTIIHCSINRPDC